MITKAIVEEVISPFQVKIRIPILDGASNSQMATKKEDLNIATICSLPNCYTNPQVGDVVFVGFEDQTYYKAVVLGHLSREAMTDTYADVSFGNIKIRSSAELPRDVTIGDVTANDISCLVGLKENIQKQIDSMKEELAAISEKLKGD